jgi:hypothetical protein
MTDPDAPNHSESNPFVHWMVINIPSTASSIAANVNMDTGRLPTGSMTIAIDDPTENAGSANYFGPCAPVGDPAHRYRYRIHALNVADITQRSGFNANNNDVALTHISATTIQTATIEVTYDR